MGFTMKIMSFYHENHGFGWTSSSRGVNFQAQGPGSRIALVGHSMGGRIAMQSGPGCLTHFQVKTCYMGCDQKSHIDHIGNLDKHHCQTFDAQYLNISSGIFEMVWWFFICTNSTDPWVHPMTIFQSWFWCPGTQPTIRKIWTCWWSRIWRPVQMEVLSLAKQQNE